MLSTTQCCLLRVHSPGPCKIRVHVLTIAQAMEELTSGEKLRLGQGDLGM